MNFGAVILAGGKSSRMGRDKAFVDINGQSLLSRQIKLAYEVGATEVFISGREGVDYSEFGCRVLEDMFQNAGPRAGIERALGASASALLLVLAVDMPAMDAGLLRRLASHCRKTTGAIPRVGKQIEPLAAFYPNTLKIELQRVGLETSVLSAKSFAEDCVSAGLAQFVDLPSSEARYFTNWNSPEDILRSPVSML